MSEGFGSTARYRAVTRAERTRRLEAEYSRRATLSLEQAMAEVRDRVHVTADDLVEVFTTAPNDRAFTRMVPLREFAAAWAMNELDRFYEH